MDEGVETYELVIGHTYEAQNLTTVSVVKDGAVENKFTIIIKDAEGNDVTENYSIDYSYGTIKIVPRPIYIVTDSGSFVYDAEAHSVLTWQYKVFEGGDDTEHYEIVASHSYETVGVPSFTLVKDTKENNNVFSIVILDPEKVDVTENYDIHYEYGTVTIAKREIHLTTPTCEIFYDGEEHEFKEWSYAEDTPYEIVYNDNFKQYASIVKFVTVKNATDTPIVNEVVIVVLDEEDTDVTENYDIRYEYGTITVKKRPVYIETGSLETVYDDNEYSDETWKYVGEIDNITRFELVDGHTWEAVGVPVFKYVTTEDSNNVFSIEIFDGEENVSSNYDVHYTYGTIRILKRVIHIETEGESWVYDDKSHSNTNWIYNPKTPYMILGVNEGEHVHTYEITYIPSVRYVTDGIVENALVFTIYDESEQDVSRNYDFMITDMGLLSVTPLILEVQTATNMWEYDGKPHSDPRFEFLGDTKPIEGHEILVIDYTTITDVGELANHLVYIVLASELDLSANYAFLETMGILTITDHCIELTPDAQSKEYDGATLFPDGFSITYGALDVGHRIVSDEIVIDGSQTEIGESYSYIIENSVRIIDEDGNDVTYMYTVSLVPGILKVTERTVTVTAGSDIKVFDGTPLTCDKYSVENLLPGHVLYAETSGSQTDIGISDNLIVLKSVTIQDSDGNDVSAYYSVLSQPGTLKVVKCAVIKVTTGSAEKEYDRLPLTSDEAEYSVMIGTMYPGDRVVIVTTGSQTEIGQSSNACVVDVLDENGISVTDRYDFEYELGTLEVNKRTVIIVTGSAEKYYDGTPLTKDEYTAKNLLEGHTISLTITGSQTEVGESDNTVNTLSVKIFDEKGNRITDSHYNVCYDLGTLKVVKRTLTITTGSNQKYYDGTPLTSDKYTYDGLAENHTLSLTITGSQTEVGESPNTILEGSIVILDKDGNDVTESHYNIILELGILKVEKRPITITTADAEKHYDGTPLTKNEYTVENLLEGHTLTLTINGSQTEVGESPNTILEGSILILDKDGKDITNSHYEIILVLGTLKVTKRPITITTADAEKHYDGTPLTKNEYTVENLLEGHTLTLTINGSQTEVGESPNTILEGSILILDKDGKDITNSHYEITLVLGTLKVIKRPITIITESDWKYYDGTPLTCDKYSVDNLIETHTISLTVNGSQTEVGESDNTVIKDQIKIFDKDGNDVTANYEILYDYGWLIVAKRAATVTTESAKKQYDGAPLTCDKYNVDNLVENHTISLTVNGSQTEIGESDNTVIEDQIKIFDKDGNDVTANYEILFNYGLLKVIEESEGGEGDGSGGGGGGSGGEGDGSGGGDGGSGGEGDGSGGGGGGSGGGGGGYGGNLDQSGKIGLGDSDGSGSSGEGESNTVLKIKSTASGTIYLRLASLGDYAGTEGWMQANEYESYIIENYGLNYLVALALKLSGAGTEQTLEIKSFTTDYLLPYFIDMKKTDHTIQDSDVLFNGTHNGNYSVHYYTYDGDFTRLRVDLGELAEVERLYREFVYSQYLKIDTATKDFIDQLILEQSWSKYDPNIVKKVQDYVQNCATYNLDYDRNLDKESNIIIAFLGDNYNEGICQHYASAATMIFRALEIPARYTIGYVGYAVKDTWVDVKSDTAHAWTEIYVDGIGWIPVEVTGGGPGGGSGGNSGGNQGGGDKDYNFDELPHELEISPIDVSKGYDGTPLYAENEIKKIYDSAIEKLLSKGFTYEVMVNGSRTEIGVSESNIIDFRLYDPNNVDVTDKFTITYLPGEVKVTNPQIIIVLYEIQKTYDGIAISYQPNDYWIKQIPSGYTLEFALQGSMTNCGQFVTADLEKLPYVVRNEKGEDVTENYYLKIEGEGLKVTRRMIEITSASAMREYNGAELTDDTVTISLGSLAKGHTLVCEVTGSITEIGTEANTIKSYTITDADGNDVTSCYDVEKVEGILEVVKGAIV